MGIGTLNEGPLHAALKEYYLRHGGQAEVSINDYVADVVRDGTIYEIQTGSFSGLNRKLSELIQSYPVRLVYPIAQHKTIVKVADDRRTVISKRRSPKKGAMTDVLRELVYIPRLLAEKNFSLDVLLIEENELRIYDPKKVRRRGGWRIMERQMISINDSLTIRSARDLYEFFEEPLSEPFITKDIELAMGAKPSTARQMAYVLRHTDLIEMVGKAGRFVEYRFKSS